MKQIFFNWIDSLLTMPVTGLDISARTIKYLAFRRTRNRRLTIDYFGEVDIPEGVVVKGEINQEGEFTEALRSLLKTGEKKIRASLFTAALPEEKSFLRLIQIPAIKQEDIAHAVRWEIENQIPLPAEEIIYDYEIMDTSEKPEHLDVQITAFPRNLISSYVRAFRAANMQLVALELESQSIVRALWGSGEAGARIILDIGRTRSSIVLFSGGTMLFTSTLEIGGIIFEKHIAEHLGVSLQEADTIKKEDGLNKKARKGEVYQALLPAVATLANELSRARDYYRGHEGHEGSLQRDIDAILLSGGDANLIGLDAYLSRTLNIPTARADPFAAINDLTNYDIPPMTRAQAMSYTAAIGLALRGAGNHSI